MHCDYQQAYCPITHIVALAFRDNAFENERLTPELVWGAYGSPNVCMSYLSGGRRKNWTFQSSDACAVLRLVLKWIRFYR